jgi:hypothetical protein
MSEPISAAPRPTPGRPPQAMHWLVLIYERVEVTRFEDREPRYMPGDVQAEARVMVALPGETEEEAAHRFMVEYGKPCFLALVELGEFPDRLYVADLDLVRMHRTSQGWSL